MRAVVLGGSFNPPTLAHRALMEHAVYHVGNMTGDEVRGIYVPSSHNYVSRKMGKLPVKSRLLFTEEARFYMLQGILKEGCSISTVEYGDDGRGHTYRTMKAIHSADRDIVRMFLLGADKLKILPRWGDIGKFLEEFPFVVTSRDGDGAKALISGDPLLSAHKGSFIMIPELPETYAGFSSTAARAAALKGDWAEAERLCGRTVANIIKESMESR